MSRFSGPFPGRKHGHNKGVMRRFRQWRKKNPGKTFTAADL